MKRSPTGERPRGYHRKGLATRRLQQCEAPWAKQSNKDCAADESSYVGPKRDPGGSGRPTKPAKQLHREPQAEQYPGRYGDPLKEDHDPDENVNVGLGIEQQVGAENPGDGTACPDHRHMRSIARKGLAQCCHDAATEIEKQKTQVPKRVFDIVAEDPQEHHVADQVEPTAVQKHAGKKGGPCGH